MSRRVVSTWFYEQSADEGGTYAQVRGDSSSEGFRDIYRRCIAVAFASARRANPDAELVLFLNKPWRTNASQTAAQVGGLMAELNVQHVELQYTFSPPSDWPEDWRNQFFVFDVLAYLGHLCCTDDLVTVLDSDIVWSGVERTEAMWRAIASDGCLTYDIGYDADQAVNGLSRRQLTRISQELGSPMPSRHDCLVAYSGGEFIALRGDICHVLNEAAAKVWPVIIDRQRRGDSTFCEEAHFLSYLYEYLGLPRGRGNDYVKRLWTQVLKSRNVTRQDLDLVLWHVPAEKRYGLRRAYDQLVSDGVEAWICREQREFKRSTSRLLGLPYNPLSKRLRDVTRAVVDRVVTP